MKNYLMSAVTLAGATVLGMFLQAQTHFLPEVPVTSTHTPNASVPSTSAESTNPDLPDAILKGFKREAADVNSPIKEKKYREEAIKTILESDFGKNLACLMKLTDGKYSIEDMTFSEITKARSLYLIFIDTKIPSSEADNESIKIEVDMRREYGGFGKYIISDNSYFVDGHSFSPNPRLTLIRGSDRVIARMTEYLINKDAAHLPKPTQQEAAPVQDTSLYAPQKSESKAGPAYIIREAATDPLDKPCGSEKDRGKTPVVTSGPLDTSTVQSIERASVMSGRARPNAANAALAAK